jgi:hypothetical protein
MAESCWRKKVRRVKDFDPEDGLLEGGGEEEGVWAWEGDGVGCDIDVVLESDGEEVWGGGVGGDATNTVRLNAFQSTDFALAIFLDEASQESLSELKRVNSWKDALGAFNWVDEKENELQWWGSGRYRDKVRHKGRCTGEMQWVTRSHSDKETV